MEKRTSDNPFLHKLSFTPSVAHPGDFVAIREEVHNDRNRPVKLEFGELEFASQLGKLLEAMA
jgi:hypothetical protein